MVEKRNRKKKKSPILKELRIACVDERRAVEFLEEHRWGDDPACPRCGSVDVYQMQDRETGDRNKDLRWRCRDCKRMYTVRTGTVFEETRLPLKVWCFAFWKACASKKGVSAKQIERECEISYKSALFLMHRIREAMAYGGPIPPRKLDGTVEADETYVGGKPRYKGQSKRGRGTKKTPVVALVERRGEVRAEVMERITADGLESALAENVERTARLITDELNAYQQAGQHFEGGHDTIKHSDGQYVVRDIYTNTVESFFSLLKRGMYGTFHSVSKKHLHRYVAEFSWRYNNRECDDGTRTVRAIRAADGKRLTYEDAVGR